MKKRLAILTTKRLFPPEDGRADTIQKRILLLSKLGYDVTVISFVLQSEELYKYCKVVVLPLRTSLFSLIKGVVRGMPLQVALYANSRFMRGIKNSFSHEKYSLVFSDMVRTSLLVGLVPADQRILDMDDVLSLRYRRQLASQGIVYSLGKSPIQLPGILKKFEQPFLKLLLRYEAYSMERFEKKIVKQFDSVILVSQKETREFKEKTGYANAYSIPNYIQFPDVADKNPVVKDIDLLFFGNLSTAHNIDSVSYIVTTVFPEIVSMLPDVKLVVIGRDASDEIVKLFTGRSNIRLYQNVDDIASYVRRATICLSPIRFGSGIKTKILESLYLGTPVVTTSIGAEGIPDAKHCMFIADTLHEQVEYVVRILNGEVDIHPMIVQCEKMLHEHFSLESVEEKLSRLIENNESSVFG